MIENVKDLINGIEFDAYNIEEIKKRWDTLNTMAGIVEEKLSSLRNQEISAYIEQANHLTAKFNISKSELAKRLNLSQISE